jgi:ketosteroid isomerase-like protein
MTMSAEQNKQTLRRFYEEVWHADNPAYDTYLAPAAASYQQQIENLKAENPSVHFDLGEIVAEGDTVVAVWTTQVMPGVEGISIWHFKDGKITDRTAYTRDLG